MEFGISQLAGQKPQCQGFIVTVLNTLVDFVNDYLDLSVPFVHLIHLASDRSINIIKKWDYPLLILLAIIL